LIDLETSRKNIKAVLKKRLDEIEKKAALEEAKKKRRSD